MAMVAGGSNSDDKNVEVKGPLRHCLFISKFILLSKFIRDDPYSDKHPSHIPKLRMRKGVRWGATVQVVILAVIGGLASGDITGIDSDAAGTGMERGE